MKRFQALSPDVLLTGISALMLAASFWFQYVQGLSPCPLCIMQRLCVALLLLSGLVLSVSKRPMLRAFLWLFQTLMALAGIFFAARQLWLQSLPPANLPACMPDLSLLLRYFPLQDVLHALFWGSGDCAEKEWSWLGISMPGWVLFYFVGVVLVSAVFFARETGHKKR
ncbi:disulfide bond formation protein DsbB [Legionella geestiana]|uniref:Disulfide bond formation protein B n=1 Tax=Legionella geestiana TaxID=45065 RepID=A0A0W0U3I8_9GAMM|nr:disulfide bond formation protein B [Legionella geestiana]KTD02335.1 disulfide bond formation protein DsbB [Legionella geestiana]QBS12190.1 disulfide bond formation protein B [Legionella geestiana]QDQ40096.1 disulfide bond formation protein B [Legionella geestiana]STX53081.1 disulfide bond formation protein DsbB [Legionella geestiana]